MGCWAVDSFGNDEALDWLSDLIEQDDVTLVHSTIAQALAVEGYLEAPEATEALAAVEVVAACIGRPTNAAQTEEGLLAWIARVKPSLDKALILQSLQAIDKILSRDSELYELWEETEEFDAWKADVANLRRQLQQ